MSVHISQNNGSTDTLPPTKSSDMNKALRQATEDNTKSDSKELSSCTPCSPVEHSQTHTLDELVAPTDSISAKVMPKSCLLWTKETAIAKTSKLVIATFLCPQYTDCINERKAERADSSVLAMGVMTGLVIILLMVMATGYIFIFWKMKKRGGIWTISSNQTR